MIRTTTDHNFIRALKFARAFTAKDDVRGYPQGVLVELCPKEIHLVGTDGHRLGYIEMDGDTRGSDQDIVRFILPNDMADKIIRAWTPKKSDSFELDLCLDGLSILVGVGEDEIRGQAIDGTFPDWRRVTTPDTLGPPVAKVFGCNFNYLADALKAAKALGGDFNSAILTAHKNMLDITIPSHYVDKARAIVMQMVL